MARKGLSDKLLPGPPSVGVLGIIVKCVDLALLCQNTSLGVADIYLLFKDHNSLLEASSLCALSLSLSLSLFVSLSLSLYLSVSISLALRLSTYLSLCIYICISFFSLCLTLSLSLSLPFTLSLSPSQSLSLYHSLSCLYIYIYMLWSYYLVQVWPFWKLLSGPSLFFLKHRLPKNTIKIGVQPFFFEKKLRAKILEVIIWSKLAFFKTQSTWTR